MAELARRAATSAPTIWRYEHGWSRFELYTLRKLAAALGCRLTLSLEPQPAQDSAPGTNELVARIGRLFWDRPLQKVDLTQHVSWVLKRVLEYGALEDVHAIAGHLGRARFMDEVCQVQFDSRRSRGAWQELLAVEGKSCTRKFSRKEAESCWKR